MANEIRPLFTLLAGAVLGIAVSVASADPGPGGGSDPSDIEDVADVDEPDAADAPDEVDVVDDASADDSADDSSTIDDADPHEDNSGSSGSSGDSDGDDVSDDETSNSGSSSPDDESGHHGGDNSGSGSSHSGDDDGSGSNSGSSGHGGNSGSGSSDDGAQLAAHPDVQIFNVERDESGHEFVSGEVLLAGASADVEAARGAGFEPISEKVLGALGEALARLRLPPGMTVAQAVATLHTLAPNAIITPNTIYRSSQSLVSAASNGSRRATTPRFVGTLGIIDTGVDAASLPNAEALLSHHAFAGRRPVGNQHGSVVAALAIEHGMRVHVADVFGQSAEGALAASAESIAAALDWMIASNVPVINVSIEGPNNEVLGDLIARAASRGHIIVAAAGNGGPMAHPAYPAAFAGSVAVTAIDEAGRPYLRANRGAYIAFAARGVNRGVHTAASDVQVSGTSFAAPIVAAAIAARLHTPSPEAARRVLEELRDEAIDLGAPGRDPIYGWGALEG